MFVMEISEHVKELQLQPESTSDRLALHFEFEYGSVAFVRFKSTLCEREEEG